MSKRRSTASKAAPARPAKPSPAKSRKKVVYIIVGVGLLAVLGLVALSGQGTGSGGSGVASASPAEQRYIGRLLPAGYKEPKVADFAVYPETVKMTDVKATDAGKTLTVLMSDVTKNKIVKFEYAKPGARSLPLMAYVKPSGKLFLAVSFCPPCEGEGQSIDPDGTLVCESCGTKRDLESGVGISGACKLYPLDELPVTVAGGKISVDKAMLDSWTAQPKDRQVGG